MVKKGEGVKRGEKRKRRDIGRVRAKGWFLIYFQDNFTYQQMQLGNVNHMEVKGNFSSLVHKNDCKKIEKNI